MEMEEREIAMLKDSDEASNKTEMDRLEELDKDGNCKACKLEEDMFRKDNKKKNRKEQLEKKRTTGKTQE